MTRKEIRITATMTNTYLVYEVRIDKRGRATKIKEHAFVKTLKKAKKIKAILERIKNNKEGLGSLERG